EELSRLARLVEHGVVHAVHDADAKRLVGVDGSTGEDELLRDPEAADAREPLRPAPPRDDPEVHLGLTELRVRRRITDVARERELAAAAEREAVHGRDRRLRHRLEEAPDLVAERTPGRRLLDAETAHVLDVRAGDECAVAGSREDEDANVLVGG